MDTVQIGLNVRQTAFARHHRMKRDGARFRVSSLFVSIVRKDVLTHADKEAIYARYCALCRTSDCIEYSFREIENGVNGGWERLDANMRKFGF